jgi:hypothetical protein
MRKTNTLINNITVTELKNHYISNLQKKKVFNFGSLRRNACVRVTVKHPCNAGLSYNKAAPGGASYTRMREIATSN